MGSGEFDKIITRLTPKNICKKLKPAALHRQLASYFWLNFFLLFAWVLLFGIFSLDYSQRIDQNLIETLLYLVRSRDGLLTLLAYLLPLVYYTRLPHINRLLSPHKRRTKKPMAPMEPTLFAPLLANIIHFAFYLRDYASFWGLWVGMVLSFYGAINLASHYDNPARPLR